MILTRHGADVACLVPNAAVRDGRARRALMERVRAVATAKALAGPDAARRSVEAYRRWGKGVQPAALNIGDCFAYELAIEHDCPLLFVGSDFALTAVRPAL